MGSEIKYVIKENLGNLSTRTGWNKQLNLVSWNDKTAKFDIREWSDDGDKMTKGITLSLDEMVRLKEILNKIDLDTIDLD